MKLYLSSEGLGNKTYVLEEWKNNNGNKILVIPNSKDYIDDETRKKKIQDKTRCLIDMGFKIKVLDLRKYFNKEKELREDIKEYRCFYVIGGNVFVLRQAMKLSGFDEYLKEIAKKENYLYIGFSAGSSILSPTLKGLDIIDEPINPYNSDNVIYDGINLIDYVFLPHYKSNHKESKKIDECIIKLEENRTKYKLFSDGDVIIEEVRNENILEKCLPIYLEEDLKNLKEGIKNNVSYLDCLINELQGSVNSAFIDGDISEKQCDYLYKKYIRMEI